MYKQNRHCSELNYSDIDYFGCKGSHIQVPKVKVLKQTKLFWDSRFKVYSCFGLLLANDTGAKGVGRGTI